MRRLAVLPLLLLVACADPAGPNGKFCDVVKRIRVTADPLAQPAAFSDSRILESALAVRVKAYRDLAAVAPVAIAADAAKSRDALVEISTAFTAAGNRSSAANEQPLEGLLRDKAFLDAQSSVTRFSISACKEPATA